jgi:hypothetical protein
VRCRRKVAGISGTAIDPTGALIPITTVTLSGPTTIEVKTDNQGKFKFSNVEPDGYKLKFRQARFQAKSSDVAVDRQPIFLGQIILNVQTIDGIEITQLDVFRGTVPTECSGSICGAVL